jgi:selenocysteine lyase/cysteine desulfurase
VVIEAIAAEPKPLGSYRELFPVTHDRAYLNHAALGVGSTRLLGALAEHLEQHAQLGSGATIQWQAQRVRLREKMAAFIGAQPGEIAMVKNTPEALGIVSNGLSWQAGDRVIISDLEFPANAMPWLKLAEQGVEVVTIHSVGGRVPLEAVIEAISPRTRLVALSLVEFSNGYRNDVKTIGDVCHQRGALLAVDAIQALGPLRVNVREQNIDFLAAASHKWLLGPPGMGWLFCRQELIDSLDVAMVGQGSYARDATTPWLAYDLPLWPDARRFEPGIPNFLGIAGLEAVLDLLFEVGIERIEDQVKHLTDRLASGLLERGYRLAAPRDGGQWSGIVSFSSENHASADLLARLEQGGVSVALREGLIRVSPHFYNDETDVERLLALLPPHGA